MCKYLSPKVMKYSNKLERLTKVNKNVYEKITSIFKNWIWFLYRIIQRIAFNIFQNKTIILEINSTRGFNQYANYLHNM